MEPSALGLFEDIEQLADDPPFAQASKLSRPLHLQPAVSQAPGGLDDLLLTPPFSSARGPAAHYNGHQQGRHGQAFHGGQADDFFSPPGGRCEAGAQRPASSAQAGDSADAWGIPDEALGHAPPTTATVRDAPRGAPPPLTPPPCLPSTSAQPQPSTSFHSSHVSYSSTITTASTSAQSVARSLPSSTSQSFPPIQPSQAGQPAPTRRVRQAPHLAPQVQMRPSGPQTGHPPVSGSGPSSSGQPMQTAQIPPGLQMVNGQLVVQAQLQQVQTPNGLITVAVIPQGLMNGMGGQLQMLQGSGMAAQLAPAQATSTHSPAPATLNPTPPPPVPAPPAKPKAARQRKQVLPGAGKKKTPKVPKVAPKTQSAGPKGRGKGGEMAVHLDAETQAEVSRLGSQIAQLRSAEADPAVQQRIADLERQRTDIISQAFLQQYGQAAAKELLSTPAPPNDPAPTPPPSQPPARKASQPPPHQPPPPQPSAQAKPTPAPQIVNMNGQQFVMLTKEQAEEQGLATRPAESGPGPMVEAQPSPAQPEAEPVAVAEEEDVGLELDDDLAELERAMELEQRRNNFLRCVASDAAALQRKEEREVPFRNKQEALVRLMPYHLYASPDPSPLFLANVDDAIRQMDEAQGRRKAALEARFSRALLKDALVESAACDESLISFLLQSHEEDLLSEERRLAAEDPDQLHSLLHQIHSAPQPPASVSSVPSTSTQSSDESSDSSSDSEESEEEEEAAPVATEAKPVQVIEPEPEMVLPVKSSPLPEEPVTKVVLPPTSFLEEEEEEESGDEIVSASKPSQCSTSGSPPETELLQRPASPAPPPPSPLKPLTLRIPRTVSPPPPASPSPPAAKLAPVEPSPLRLRIPKIRFKNFGMREEEATKKEKVEEMDGCSKEPGPSRDRPPPEPVAEKPVEPRRPRAPLKLRIKQLAAAAAASPAMEEESIFDRLRRMSPTPPPPAPQAPPAPPAAPEAEKPIRIKVKLKRPLGEEERDENHRRKEKKKRKKERRKRERAVPKLIVPPIRLPAVPIWRQESQPAPRLFIPKLKIKLSQVTDEPADCRLVIDEEPAEEDVAMDAQPSTAPKATFTVGSGGLEASDSEVSEELEPKAVAAPPASAMDTASSLEEEELSDELGASPAAGPSASDPAALPAASSNIFSLFQPTKYTATELPPLKSPPLKAAAEGPAAEAKSREASPAFDESDEEGMDDDALRANIRSLISTELLAPKAPADADVLLPPRFSFEGAAGTATAPQPPPPLGPLSALSALGALGVTGPGSSEAPLTNSDSSGPDEDQQLSAIINSFLN